MPVFALLLVWRGYFNHLTMTSFFSPWTLPFLVVFIYNISFEWIFISVLFCPLCSRGYSCNRVGSWQTKVLFYSGGDCLLSKMAPPNKSCLAIFHKVAIWQLYVKKILMSKYLTALLEISFHSKAVWYQIYLHFSLALLLILLLFLLISLKGICLFFFRCLWCIVWRGDCYTGLQSPWRSSWYICTR
jgi:hypothetical protein